jgi:xylan 1,4-beta-xylosidase
MVGARWAEAPHIYEIDGAFYLLAAEGGTAQEHAVVVARAEQVTGPYVGFNGNPVLTHRHLGKGMSIVGTGHADLVQTPAGDWWAVLLAMRPYDGYCWNLGRETFLVPVTWEDGWPMFNYGIGRVLLDERLPALPPNPWTAEPGREHFDGDTLGPTWLFVRTPREQWWSLRERPSHLRIRLRAPSISGNENPSFVGRRQQHRAFLAATSVDIDRLADNETAGLVLRHSDEHSVRLELALVDGSRVVRVVRRVFGVDDVVDHTRAPDGPVQLAIEARGMSHDFRVRDLDGNWLSVARLDARFLSFTEAEGFFGVVIAMFASSNGSPGAGDGKPSVADFDWFDYSGS